MVSKKIEEFLRKARESDEYWVEGAILDFTEELATLMAKNNVSRTELAKRIGTSPAYITKVLRGNVNFTLASMVKLARALGAEIRVHIAGQPSVTHWVDEYRSRDLFTEFCPGEKVRARHVRIAQTSDSLTENSRYPVGVEAVSR